MRFNETIFKKYDIRGVYDKDFNDKFAYYLGGAVARYFDSDIMISKDGRLSSNVLEKNFIQGVLDSGYNIVKLGLISTPASYYAIIEKNLPLTVITASHNPKEYNGFKIMTSDLKPVDLGSGLLDIKDDLKNFKKKEQGVVEEFDVTSFYFDFLQEFVKNKDVKLVIDQGNGSGWLETEFLKNHYNTIVLNNEIDGNFPVHKPDPLDPKAVEVVKKEVLKNKADLGILFDGDADRAFFVDEKANLLRAEHVASLMVDEGLVFYDVRASHALSKICEDKDVDNKMIACGRSLFINEMNKENGSLGVEGSGHYFFKELKGTDSAILAVIKVLNSLKEGKLSELVSFPDFYHSNEINLRVKDREETINKVKKEFENEEIKIIDGISVFSKDYWFNIRKSNTEPVIRINAEAKSEIELNKLVDKLKKITS